MHAAPCSAGNTTNARAATANYESALLFIQHRQSAATEVTTPETFPALGWRDTFSEPDPSTVNNTRQTKKRKCIRGSSEVHLSQVQQTIFLTDRAKLVYVPRAS
ncbi:hypothetical protein MTO96_050458 [Rhipicephalus appendiculatus]